MSEILQSSLPNTLNHVLGVFPLAESRQSVSAIEDNRDNKGKKRTFSQEFSHDTTSETQKLLRSVLFPSIEDNLGTALQRFDFENTTLPSYEDIPKPPAKRPKLALVELTQRIEASLGITAEPRIPTFQFKEKLIAKRARRWKPVEIEMLPVKEYQYLPPNELGLCIVQPYQLFEYQLQSVKWMLERELNSVNPYWRSNQTGGLLVMSMGLGKSCTAAALIAATLHKQRAEKSCTLYVCPKNLLGTVRVQIEKFFGSQLNAIIFHPDFLRNDFDNFGHEEICKYDIIITNYDTIVTRLKKSLESPQQKIAEFMKFQWFRVILDESHEIREQSTQRFQAVLAIQAMRRFCMTGSPIYNKIGDLFHQLMFTGLHLPKGTKFTKGMLRSLNILPMIHNVEYKDAVDIKLPQKSTHHVYFDLSLREKQLHAYYTRNAQIVYEQYQKEIGRNKAKKYMEAHASMIRVMQICSAPYLITPNSKTDHDKSDDIVHVESATVFPADAAVNNWIQQADGEAGIGASKMKTFVQLIYKLEQESDEKNPLKLVVFANYTCTLRLAIRALIHSRPQFHNHYVFVHGGITSSHKRELLYTKFRVEHVTQILFTTLKLGSLGLNLSEANQVIFLESWYSFAALAQGEGRVWRIGQIRPVHIYYLLAKDSIEEHIFRIAMSKKRLDEDVKKEQKLTPQDMRSILFNKVANDVP